MLEFLMGLNHAINLVIPFVIALVVLLMLAGVIVGIVCVVGAVGEKDPKRKHKAIMWAIIWFVAPVSLLFITVSIWGLSNIVVRSLTHDPMSDHDPMAPPAGMKFR